MKFFLFEVRDSDGNDCTVFDVIVSAESREKASEKLWKHLDESFPDDESDGGFGTFHACDCACEHRKTMVCAKCADSWECSHGGLLTNEDADGEAGPREFATFEDADAERSRFHVFVDLT